MILCLVGLKTHLFHLNLNRTSDQDRPVREGSSLTLSRMLADADADADAYADADADADAAPMLTPAPALPCSGLTRRSAALPGAFGHCSYPRSCHSINQLATPVTCSEANRAIKGGCLFNFFSELKNGSQFAPPRAAPPATWVCCPPHLAARGPLAFLVLAFRVLWFIKTEVSATTALRLRELGFDGATELRG